jgi:hypothetical protein
VLAEIFQPLKTTIPFKNYQGSVNHLPRGVTLPSSVVTSGAFRDLHSTSTHATWIVHSTGPVAWAAGSWEIAVRSVFRCLTPGFVAPRSEKPPIDHSFVSVGPGVIPIITI